MVCSEIRKIVHVDCDCFYVAVEIRENPDLHGLPVAVGGSPHGRGVIATCSYEARSYGVCSAMASAHAIKLCPQLQIISPRFELYRSVSRELHKIFADYTPVIEPLSLDEAFLDVSTSRNCCGSATLIAKEIRQRVQDSIGITVSAGVAPNKFLAKVASDWNKPNGLMVITPQDIDEFVKGLPVRKLFGVGKVTNERLESLAIRTCADLQRWSQPDLKQHFGCFGLRLYELARGIDERPVQPLRRRKSLSVERTFHQDLTSWQDVANQLPILLDDLQQRFRAIQHEYGISKCYVKIKFSNFVQTTMEEVYVAEGEVLFDAAVFLRLMKTAWLREKQGVRLLGLGVRLRSVGSKNSGQMSLFL